MRTGESGGDGGETKRRSERAPLPFGGRGASVVAALRGGPTTPNPHWRGPQWALGRAGGSYSGNSL